MESSCMTYWWGFSLPSLQEVVVLVRLPVIAWTRGFKTADDTTYEFISRGGVSLYRHPWGIAGLGWQDLSTVQGHLSHQRQGVQQTQSHRQNLECCSCCWTQSVVAGLPTPIPIHVLCGLSPQELVTSQIKSIQQWPDCPCCQGLPEEGSIPSTGRSGASGINSTKINLWCVPRPRSTTGPCWPDFVRSSTQGSLWSIWCGGETTEDHDHQHPSQAIH